MKLQRMKTLQNEVTQSSAPSHYAPSPLLSTLLPLSSFFTSPFLQKHNYIKIELLFLFNFLLFAEFIDLLIYSCRFFVLVVVGGTAGRTLEGMTGGTYIA